MLKVAFAACRAEMGERGLFPRLVQRTQSMLRVGTMSPESSPHPQDVTLRSLPQMPRKNKISLAAATPRRVVAVRRQSRREIGISARQRTHRRESLIAGISETATSCQPVDVNGQSCSVCALSIDRSLQRLMCTRNVCVLLPYVIHISDTMLVCAVAFRARDLLSRRVVLRMHFGSVRLFRC